MATVFIGVGSNEGDRLAIISSAIKQLGCFPGIAVTQMATILETEPIGPPQGAYLNTVVEVETTVSPRELLAILKRLEQTFGRSLPRSRHFLASGEGAGSVGRVPNAVRWGPRPLDFDILLYGDQVVREADLVIPHERLHERRFVLEPLAQLAPELVHPVLGKTIRELLANSRQQLAKKS